MLPKKLRLSRKEVAEVFKSGDTKKSRLFIVRALPSLTKELRFATVISTKVDKKAAKRNLLRRRMQEAIRKNLHLAKETTSIELVIIPKKITIEKSYEEIEDDIKHILKNLKQWANTLKT